MGNNYFTTVTDEKIESFIHSFTTTAKKLYMDSNGALRHSAEYGLYRERACIELFEMFIPVNYGISSGFIITKHDEISTQCDIIIYDKNKMPSVSVDKNKIFLAEAVSGVVEVKSSVNSTELKEALSKLSKIKNYKYQQIGNTPHTPLSDMFSAVIMYDYQSSLDNITTFIDESVYDSGINPRNKHNVIIDLKNGIIGYDCLRAKEKYEWLKRELEKPNTLSSDVKEKAMQEIGDLDSETLKWRFCSYPTIFDIALTSTFDRIVADNKHLKVFLNYLHQMTIKSITTYPDINQYLGIE